MMKRLLIFYFIIFITTVTYGQKLGDYYLSIAIDSTQNCRLKFLNDSAVELSNIPRHMGRLFSKVFVYKNTDTTIEILTGELSNQDQLSLKAFGLDYFAQPIVRLTRINKGFIDYGKSLIYVRAKDFGSNPDLTYIIDGKTYIQDVGVTDGYGIIKKKPRRNKALQRQLRNLDKDNCTIEFVKGLNAYQRFGIKRVYGVIVIMTKPKTTANNSLPLYRLTNSQSAFALY